MADWRQFYTAAILNTNPPVSNSLDEASHAMDLRLDEIANAGGSFEERREIVPVLY
jgi:hypothetical protein